MPYASDTSVPVERSQREIEDLVTKKYGARKFARGFDEGQAVISFELNDRRVQFTVQIPSVGDVEKAGGRRRRRPAEIENARAQLERARWRALALTVKAKLVSVESGVEAFEEAFLAQIIVPHGGRAIPFYKAAQPALAAAYGRGELPPLLPSGESK